MTPPIRMVERNAKVRRRLAAGKLHLRICDLRNLGPRAEALLATVGIRSSRELRERGALEAYLALRRAGYGRSLNMLWALVGALEPWPEGRDWREVARSPVRLPLLLAVEARDSARESTLQAAGQPPSRGATGRSPRGSRGQTAGRSAPLAGDGGWVPGLPFDAADQKKNRPSGRSSGATPRGARGR